MATEARPPWPRRRRLRSASMPLIRSCAKRLVAELRDRISAMSPTAFEDLVLDVLHAMGYGRRHRGLSAAHRRQRRRRNRRRIREDRLGLDVVYVQAKRWEATVGTTQSFRASSARSKGARASKGIIFTASDFSADARSYANTVSPRVILVDGERLAALMIDYNVGVSERETIPREARRQRLLRRRDIKTVGVGPHVLRAQPR